MLLFLLLIFNALILFVALDLVIGSFYNLTPHQGYLLIAAAIGLVCALAFLFYSPVGQWRLRLFSGTRKPIEREKLKLFPIIEQVQEAVFFHFDFKPLTLHSKSKEQRDDEQVTNNSLMQ